MCRLFPKVQIFIFFNKWDYDKSLNNFSWKKSQILCFFRRWTKGSKRVLIVDIIRNRLHWIILYILTYKSILVKTADFAQKRPKSDENHILYHRSWETRLNLLFQFAPEKLGRFERQCWNFLTFQNGLFFLFRLRAKFVRFPVVYDFISVL